MTYEEIVEAIRNRTPEGKEAVKKYLMLIGELGKVKLD